MRRQWMILGALIASLLLATIAVAAPNGHDIDWWVMGGGGGSGVALGATLDSTIGQWIAGSGASDGTQLGSGFWGGGELMYAPSHAIHLPLVLRNAP